MAIQKSAEIWQLWDQISSYNRSLSSGVQQFWGLGGVVAGDQGVNRLPAGCQTKVPKTARNAELCIEKMLRCGIVQLYLHSALEALEVLKSA